MIIDRVALKDCEYATEVIGFLLQDQIFGFLLNAIH